MMKVHEAMRRSLWLVVRGIGRAVRGGGVIAVATAAVGVGATNAMGQAGDGAGGAAPPAEPRRVPTGHAWRPLRTYVGVNQSVFVDVDVAGLTAAAGAADDALVSLEVIVAGSEVDRSGAAQAGETLATTELEAAPDEAGVARVDLAEAFPLIWSRRGEAATRVLYVQPVVGDARAGAPLIVEPQVRPRRVMDGVSGRLLQAILNRQVDAEQLSEFVANLRRLPPGRLQRVLGEALVLGEPTDVVSGVRVWERRDVVLETELGRIVFRLRPDAAPETAYRILELAEGGWYDGVVFHRVVPQDRNGDPFVIQAGDPTGTGAGGPGFRLDFEPSPLLHDFGVVSMARQGNDPNSNGSQFFICLSRAGTQALDGGYVAFGEVVEGAQVVADIASVPTGDEPGQSSRPLDPPMIVRGLSRSAAAVGARSRAAAVAVGEGAPVER